MNRFVMACPGPALVALAARGGGSDSSATAQAPTANTRAIVVDQGPAALVAAGSPGVDQPLAPVTLCAPGSTTACQTIDHLLVDSGSSGLRIIASAPGSCVSGPDESSVLASATNGVLGIGNFLQDCGDACASSALPGTCCARLASGGTGCTPVAVAPDRQVANPAALLPTDNNGVVIERPGIAAMGAASAMGTATFGIGTRADNDTGRARFFGLDDAGTLTTVFGGPAQSGSFIDSGSNGLYFSDPSLPLCSDASDFYCPAQTMTLGAVVQGLNGATATVSFMVANADQLFGGEVAAAPALAGPGASFDWGLPFFFGRRVYVLFEGRAAGSTTGPAIGF